MSDSSVDPPQFQTNDVLIDTRDPATTEQASKSERTVDPRQRNVATASDPLGTGSTFRTAFQDTVFFVGKVVAAIPYLHHYKVQVAGGPTVEAILLGNSSSVSVGARSATLLPPGSHVCVYKPPGYALHIILGCMPALSTNDKYNVAQILQLGSNSQVRSQDGYRQLTKLKNNGGINHFGAGRPLDGNAFEHSIVTETGVSLLIDSYQAALSINESCGIFLNWWDSHTRISGQQLDIQSYADHIMQRYDEGENLYVRGGITYPWEATGYYKHGEDFTKENKASDYQTKKDKPFGFYDLKEGEFDLAPIYRYMEYGGYLGQGYTRMLMKPAKEDGKRQFSKSDDPDYGLWQESIALDGSYTMRSAKSVYIGKYILIPIPKREKTPEDQKDSDDAREDNYKFSGEFGGGDEHKVKDVKAEGDDAHLRRVSGVLDLLTYNYNWKNTHPFFYHKKDYKFFEESDLDKMSKAQVSLNYGSPQKYGYLKEPENKQLKIDDRYNQVKYYQSMSYLTFLEDGGVALGDGYGSQISMTGGKMRLEAPLDIMILPGARCVTLCDEAYIRAKNNIEFSTSEKDIRFKAEKNMQFLAGNSGSGGMLFESNSSGSAQVYQDLYGEQVYASGIVFLAKKSDIGVLSKNVYIRSGAAEQKGSITLDSAQGEEDLVCYSRMTNMFNSKGVNIWHSPQGEEGGTFDASHRFAKDCSMISGHVLIDKWMISRKGGLITEKTIGANASIIAIKKMAQQGGGMVGDSKDAAGDIIKAIQMCDTGMNTHKDMGEPIWKAVLKQKWYQSPMFLGNKELITKYLGFSFNDRKSGPGFNLDAQWGLMESRWQQYVRLKLASGGTQWTEKKVMYQGSELYPFPGKKLWKQDTKFVELEKLNLFDKDKKHAKDRESSKDKYEEPELGEFKEKVADGNYKINSSS
tara:strand:- start:14455 stop:17208 length:2754 start_codon:yes stop_codon:yes gene_type:complete